MSTLQIFFGPVQATTSTGANGECIYTVDVDSLIQHLDFTQLSTVQCQDIINCVVANGTAAQYNTLLTKLDFNNLTGAQCVAIFNCILNNGSSAQFTQLLQLFDMSQLTPAQCQAIFGCIINNGSTTQFDQFFSNFNFSNLSAAQCVDALNCVLQHGTAAQFVTLLGLLDFGNLTSAQCLDIANCIANNPSAVTILQNALSIGAVNITNIDLQPTGNPNEFTVVVNWIDSSGVNQTTTDATPVTVASTSTVNFNTLSAADCQAIFNCILTNGTPGQYTQLLQTFDFSQLSTAQCMAIVQEVISADTGNSLSVGNDGKLYVSAGSVSVSTLNFNQLTPTQCQTIYQCIIDNGTTAQHIQFLQNLDFTQMTNAQCDALAGVMISTNTGNALTVGTDGKLYVAVGSVNVSTLNFSQLTPAQCQTIYQCIIDNGTTAQHIQFLQNMDFTQMTNAQCDALAQVIISSDTGNKIKIGTDGKLMVESAAGAYTKLIEEFAANLGVNQIQSSVNVIPINQAQMTWTPDEDVTGNIRIRFEDPNSLTSYAVILEIASGGTVLATLTATNSGSGFYVFDFGSFSFDFGVTYTLTPSTTANGILMHLTDSSPQTAPQVQLVTPDPSGDLPVISIIHIDTDSKYTVATLSDGSKVACNSQGTVVAVDPNWVPCDSTFQTGALSVVQS